MILRCLLACVFSVAFSFFVHKIIGIQELYFIFGAIDMAIVLFIIRGDL